MFGLLVMPKNPYHVRSTSLPSRSHPVAGRIEEQLSILKTWETHSPSIRPLRDGLDGLKVLYECVDDLLQSTQTKNALIHNRCEKWVDEVLDGSLGILDVCCTTRDVFMQMEENLKDLQSALRRRRSREDDLGNKVAAYMSSKKKIKKKMNKCLSSLKKMESKCNFPLLSDSDQCLATVIRVLREVRLITITIFESLLSFMSSSSLLKQSSLVSKLIGSGRIACEVEMEKMNEMERMDASLFTTFHGNKSCKDIEAEPARKTQTQLDLTVSSIQDLEDGLDSLYRSLLKSRVSLLNILNH